MTFSPKIKVAVLSLTVLCSAAYLIVYGVRDTMVYYLTVSEFERTAAEGKRYRVSGPVEKNSILKDPEGVLRFSIGDDNGLLAVSYRGPVPDTFREGVEAVVEGVYRGAEIFEADVLLAKCPTKYEPADGVYSENNRYR